MHIITAIGHGPMVSVEAIACGCGLVHGAMSVVFMQVVCGSAVHPVPERLTRGRAPCSTASFAVTITAKRVVTSEASRIREATPISPGASLLPAAAIAILGPKL